MQTQRTLGLRCEEPGVGRGAPHKDGGELVTDVANEKDVGPDSLRIVCIIERVKDPPVLSQHRGVG